MLEKTVLSFDVAMKNLGWACLKGGCPVACGVIKPQVPKELLCLKGSKKLLVRQKNELLVKQMVEGVSELITHYRPDFITGEMTTGGAKSASAATQLNMAMAAVLSVCIMQEVNYRWCSPGDVKKITVGNSKASKEQIMDWAIDRYGGDKSVKEISIQKGKRAGKVDRRLTYEFLGNRLPAGTFEHIADACGAYEAVKKNMTTVKKPGAKGYRNKPKQCSKR